ncbi:MAG: hypothetical protein JO307_04920, partial [Bryobacterales bacterium]|nr:hypothetical protein [Bryobacterales bacterium]
MPHRLDFLKTINYFGDSLGISVYSWNASTSTCTALASVSVGPGSNFRIASTSGGPQGAMLLVYLDNVLIIQCATDTGSGPMGYGLQAGLSNITSVNLGSLDTIPPNPVPA